MNSIRLFCPNLAVGTSTVSEDEAHHAAVVLRARDGAAVTLFDGAGGEAAGTIVHISKRGLRVEVARVDQRPFDAAYRITLAVAMGKAHRQGYLIEKCTELGVAEIWPIYAERSVARPRASAVGKWTRRAVEAAKQSRSAWVPTIAPPQEFGVSLQRAKEFDACCVTDVDASLPPFSSFLAKQAIGGRLLVWVGPEGGWSESERQAASGVGAIRARLAPAVLRTETAAVAVCAAAALAERDISCSPNEQK